MSKAEDQPAGKGGLSLEERAGRLGPLVSFNPAAFAAGGGVSQHLCDTMLALALAFNDLREVNLLLDQFLPEEFPPPNFRINRYFGEQGGATTFCFRILVGILHELGEVVRDHSAAFHEEFFRESVLPKLPEYAVDSWRSVQALATGKKAEKALDKLLEDVRNQAAFHYGGAALRSAFERRFPTGSDDLGHQPLASLGDQPLSRRFYFADACALDLIEAAAVAGRLSPLGKKLANASRDMSIALALLVEAFIQARGGWKEFAEQHE